VHLPGFTTELNYDARTYKRQNWPCSSLHNWLLYVLVLSMYWGQTVLTPVPFHCHTNYECALGSLKMRAVCCGTQKFWFVKLQNRKSPLLVSWPLKYLILTIHEYIAGICALVCVGWELCGLSEWMEESVVATLRMVCVSRCWLWSVNFECDLYFAACPYALCRHLLINIVTKYLFFFFNII
jgi:hypothetical protein